MKKIGLKVTTVALTLGLAAAGISPASAAGTLAGGGASFQADFQSKCLARFNTAGASVNKGIQVTYATSSSGGGRTALGAATDSGTVRFAGADSLGKAGSLDDNNSIWFPVAAAPLVIMVNLKTSTNSKISSLRLDAATIEGIFTGSITNWNNSAIQTLNPSVRLPNQAISVVTRSTDSGSTGNFKTYLKANVPSSNLVSGNQSNTGFVNTVTAATSTDLVTAVAAAQGRIGYADLSDVTSAVTKVSVKNKNGDFVLPTATAASNYVKASGVLTLQGSNANTKNGGTYTVDFTKSVKNAYQLTFITYMVGRNDLPNTDLKVYATYVLNKCTANPASIGATGYTSIGASLITAAKAQVAKL